MTPVRQVDLAVHGVGSGAGPLIDAVLRSGSSAQEGVLARELIAAAEHLHAIVSQSVFEKVASV
jgi:hypothetical protein